MLALVLAACGSDYPEGRCVSSGAWGGDQVFVDVTDELGLTGVRGSRLSAADLDGDGYPELVVSEGTTHARDTYAEDATRYRWLLYNREEAGRRVFVDGSQASGLFATRDGAGGHSASIHIFGDVDNDGDVDAFAGVFTNRGDAASDPGDRSELYLNDGRGRFVLADAPVLEPEDGYATAGAAFTDFDQDGLLDLWVVGWYRKYGQSIDADQDRLLLGTGAGFDDVTSGAGLEMEASTSYERWLDGTGRRPGYGATACDLTGDGVPELLATNYARMWNQQWSWDGEMLVDRALESGFAGDEAQDYSDNHFYRCFCEVHGCDPDPGAASLGDCDTYAAYWNEGVDDQPARLNGNSFTTVCGDLEGDGDLDLVTAEIVHWHIGSSSDPTEVLLNDGTGSFTRPGNEALELAREWPSASWNAGDITAAMADFDNDGWQDLWVGSSDYPDTRLFLWRQVSELAFEEVGLETGGGQEWPAGLVILDWDRDGDLDFCTGQSTARSGTPWEDHQLRCYENQTGGNAATLWLQGETVNRAGIGARVTVSAEGRSQTFEVGGGHGHFGLQHDVGVHAGLGAACSYDVEVAWPGGETESWTEVPVGWATTLIEGGGVRFELPR